MSDLEFLEERHNLYALVKEGIDVHPSKEEIEQFELLAKQIDPDRNFPWRGCQSCVNDLVKYVFDNKASL